MSVLICLNHCASTGFAVTPPLDNRIYYGRAIELLERYLLEGDEEALPRADLIKSMQHEAEALNKIYIAKDMKYEQAMLKKKMLQYGIDLK